MTHRGLRWLVPLVALPLALSACGGDDGPEFELVAGGGDDPDGSSGETIRLDGYPLDLDASDGTVHLLAFDDSDRRRLVTIDPDGAVTTVEVPDGSRHLAAGAGGDVHVATDDAIYLVDGSQAVPVVATADSSAAGPDVVSTDGSIEGMDVDGDGRLVWTESFMGTAPDDGEPSMLRVMRLDGDRVEHVAGASSADITGNELVDLQAAPPSDIAAVDLPLRPVEGGIAAGDDGSVYLSRAESILRFDADGGVEAVTGPGERELPDEPFGDEGQASDFNGSWASASMDASGGTLVVTDLAGGGEQVDVEPFAWSGDLGDGAQEVADKISHPRGVDGSFDLEADTTQYGALAVVIREDAAATALAHASMVALADGVLYAVGQTRTRDDSNTDDAEMLIVRTELPDDWR